MRTKTKPLPFNLLDVADADTVDYNGDTNIQDVNLNKIAILTAKKISDKYRNIGRKRKRATSPEPIVLELKKTKTASSQSRNKSARIATKMISVKYKNIRTNTKSLPFNLSDVADADTVDYNEDTNIEDLNLSRNAILTTNKISNKYKNIRRKTKRAVSPKPIVLEIKKAKTASSQSRNKSARIAAKEISDKYKRLRYGR